MKGNVNKIAMGAAATVIGVIIAGAIMNALRDVEAVDYARNGYDV